MRIKQIVSILALLGAVGFGDACNCGKDGRGTRGPDGDGPPGAVTDPSKASAEAKADFAEVARRYEAARKNGKLSGGQCESFSKDFMRVYKKHGSQMTMAWFNAGAVWEECGQIQKAEEIYRAIIDREPKFDLAYNNLGVIYWNRSQESRALDYFKRAVQQNPKTTAPRNNLAAALRNKYSVSAEPAGFSEAETQLQTVLAVDSSNRAAYENLARLYYDRGRLKDKSYLLLAQLVVTQANRIFKEAGFESSDIYNIEGLLFMEYDNQVDALRAFRKAAEIEPSHADAHMNMAMISLRFRDYPQAEKSLGIALKDKRQKKNIETYLGLGVAQRGLRKYGKAEESFKRAMKVDSKDPRALYNLGILYQEHIAPASDGDGVKESKVAREYFGKFVGKAGGDKRWATEIADAKQRVGNIDQYFRDLEEMKKLEAEAKRLEEVQKKQEAEERKRLLDLEDKARKAAAAAASGGGGGADEKKEEKKPDAKPEAKKEEKKPDAKKKKKK
jgi:tetratricopeptide (TPR) repeat protein